MKKTLSVLLLIVIFIELIVLTYSMITSNTTLTITALIANGVTVIIAYFLIRFHNYNKNNK